MEDVKDLVPHTEDENFGIAGLLNNAIVNAWESIDLYNSILATLSTEEVDAEVSEIINNLIEDRMIHVGQLEKALSTVSPNAALLVSNDEDILIEPTQETSNMNESGYHQDKLSQQHYDELKEILNDLEEQRVDELDKIYPNQRVIDRLDDQISEIRDNMVRLTIDFGTIEESVDDTEEEFILRG